MKKWYKQYSKLNKREKHMMFMMMSFDIARYIFSCTKGREDGYEKATRHMNLCKRFVACISFSNIDNADDIDYSDEFGFDLYQEVHDDTQKMTSNLYKELDMDENLFIKEYQFFDKFIKIAEDTTKKFLDNLEKPNKQ